MEINSAKNLGCYSVRNSLMFFNFNLGKKAFEYNKEQTLVLSFRFRQDGLLGMFTNQDGFLKVLNIKSRKLLK